MSRAQENYPQIAQMNAEKTITGNLRYLRIIIFKSMKHHEVK
jgi:hypothetical protein